MYTDQMSEEDFYQSQSEASQIKTRIVTKYFKFWSRIMIPHIKKRGKKLAYFDLYAGPGSYDDGTKSTPILILEEAVSNSDLSTFLVTVFNDMSSKFTEQLRQNIGRIDGIDSLAHAPVIVTGQVDDSLEELFSEIDLVPSFSFIDPFGYKGVTLRLLHGMLKDWGCDLVLFFSYNRINAAINNEAFEEHATKLFGGEDRLKTLREALEGRAPSEREAIVLEGFSEALRHMGFEYVLPFTFKRADMRRTSHHLIFVTKNILAYTVMKEIMAAESSESNQGVATFTYTRSLTQDETPLLYLLERPLDELGEMLLAHFSGQTLTMKDVFERHHVGTQFIKNNYKAALLGLEENSKINTLPSNRRAGTFGDNVLVTFPGESQS